MTEINKKMFGGLIDSLQSKFWHQSDRVNRKKIHKLKIKINIKKTLRQIINKVPY